MKPTLTFCLLVFLFACDNGGDTPSPSLPAANPLSEISYDFDSGERVAERTFEYNANGKVIHEKFTDFLAPSNNTEASYEYDASGELVKKTVRLYGYGDMNFVNFFKYKNGLLSVDSSFYDTSPEYWTSLRYFYGSDNIADSIQRYEPITGRNSLYAGTSIYHYNTPGQLTLETYTLHDGGEEATINEYSYEGNNLVKSCHEGNCILKEYNADNQVTKSTIQYGFSDIKHVTETCSYTNKILTEKILYLYETYDLNADYNRRTKVEFSY